MLPVVSNGTMWRRIGIGLLALVLVAGVAACGDDDDVEARSGTDDRSTDAGDAGGGLYGTPEDTGGDEGGASSAAGSITIEDFAFPATVGATVGATVTVTNNDSTTHTVTADDGAFDVTADPGQPAELTAPSEPGEYPFHCGIHPSMTSTLVVT
ncbi:MAG: cupredoxin domain-containing protein [Acidimicrobiales bacterium]